MTSHSAHPDKVEGPLFSSRCTFVAEQSLSHLQLKLQQAQQLFSYHALLGLMEAAHQCEAKVEVAGANDVCQGHALPNKEGVFQQIAVKDLQSLFDRCDGSFLFLPAHKNRTEGQLQCRGASSVVVIVYTH